MAALTFFMTPDVNGLGGGGGGSNGLLDTVDPGAEATTATGWTVAKVAPTVYATMSAAAKATSAGFGASVLPDTSISDQDGSYLRTGLTSISGTFDAGVWTSTFKVIASASGGDQDGAMMFRLWRATVSATLLSGFTELTSAVVTCGTVTNLATTAAQTSAGSTPSIGPFTLTHEALILDVAWKITGAGGGNTRDVLLRKGTGITLVTPNFTAAAATPFYSQQGSLRNDPDSIQNIGQAVKRGAYFCLGEKWARRRSGLIVPSADRSFAFA